MPACGIYLFLTPSVLSVCFQLRKLLREGKVMKLFSKLCIAALAMAGLSSNAYAKLEVVASFSILGDMVEQVAGAHANVTTIVGPDADAHLYSPNIADALAVEKADVIFVNGMGFETWSAKLIETSNTKAAVFVATDGIAPLLVDGEVDPHAWNSLTNGIIYVNNIEKALSEASPEHAADFKANADAYRAKLGNLHERALSDIAKLPQDNRVVVTAHDAFGYLASTYGLMFLAPQGIDTEAEPSAKEVAALIAFLKDRKAGALFVENIANGDLVAQISRETGIEIGGQIYSDALSVKGSPATSYLAMFDHNLTLITKKLSSSN